MVFRTAVVALLISSLMACTVPRTALVTGAATLIVGGSVFAHESDYKSKPCQSVYWCGPDPRAIGALGEDIGAKLLGSALLLVGLGIVASGVVGLAQEKAREVPPLPGALPPPAPLVAPRPPYSQPHGQLYNYKM